MAHKIALLNIVTAREVDSLTALSINVRFEAFFARFCETEGIDIEKAANTARAILEEAGIPQWLAMTCETCKHFRKVKDLRDRDGSPLTLHYCHAISSLPYRTPDYPACKKWSANPDKI